MADELTREEKFILIDQLAEPAPVDFRVWRYWLAWIAFWSLVLWLLLFSILKV